MDTKDKIDIEFNRSVNEALRKSLEEKSKEGDIIFTENKRIWGKEGLKPREPNISRHEDNLAVYLDLDGVQHDGLLCMRRKFYQFTNDQLEENGFPKESVIKELEQMHDKNTIGPINELERSFSFYLRDSEKHFKEITLDDETLELLNSKYLALEFDTVREPIDYYELAKEEPEIELKSILADPIEKENSKVSLLNISKNIDNNKNKDSDDR